MGMERLNDFWRICRVVSHEGRLKLLQLLLEGGELCVNELMMGTEMTQPNASIQMKTLYMAGLVRFRREEMNVIYRAEADSRVACAEEMLNALEICFKNAVSFKSIRFQITAFTHERRIEVARMLREAPLSFIELQDRCAMTSSALSRHLLKLEARRVVRWDGNLYRISDPPERLGRTLLRIVCSQEEE